MGQHRAMRTDYTDDRVAIPFVWCGVPGARSATGTFYREIVRSLGR